MRRWAILPVVSFVLSLLFVGAASGQTTDTSALQARIDELQRQLTEQQAQAQRDAAARDQQYQTQIQQEQQRLQTLQQELQTQMQQQTTASQTQIKELQDQITQSQQKLQEVEQQRQTEATAAQQKLQEAQTKAEQDLATARQELTAAQQQAQQEQQKTQTDLTATKQQLDNTTKTLESTQTELTSTKQELEKTQTEMTAMAQRLAQLERAEFERKTRDAVAEPDWNSMVSEIDSQLGALPQVMDVSDPGVVFGQLTEGVQAYFASKGGGGSYDQYGNLRTGGYVSAGRPDFVDAGLQAFLADYYKDKGKVCVSGGDQAAATVASLQQQRNDAIRDEIARRQGQFKEDREKTVTEAMGKFDADQQKQDLTASATPKDPVQPAAPTSSPTETASAPTSSATASSTPEGTATIPAAPVTDPTGKPLAYMGEDVPLLNAAGANS